MARDTEFVRGADKLAERLRRIRERTTVVLGSNVIGQMLLRRTKQRFDEEVDPNQVKWKPLAPATVKRKRRIGARRQILQESGRLRRSLAIIRGATAGLLTSATGAETRIGVKDRQVSAYARPHQSGDGVAQRRFLGIGAADIRAVDSLLRRDIIRATGLR